MSRLPPKLSDEDARLFREAVKDARPIKRSERASPPPPAHPPVAVQGLIDEREALRELATGDIPIDLALETGEEASYVRAGYSPLLLRKLRRARWVVQDEIDLHGATRESARALLAEFLRDCVQREVRCARVIHGKRRGSPNREPVLKGKVRGWLAQREEVIAFCQAPPLLGGSGALLVLLRA